MQFEVLLKILLAVSSSLPLTVCLISRVTRGSSTISKQLEVEWIMVRVIMSICKLSLPLRVSGLMRLTHKHSYGVLMLVLGGRCLYLSFCLLLDWQVLQDLIIDQMVVHFEDIAALIVSLRRVCPGYCKLCWYHITAHICNGLGITSQPSFADTSCVLNELDLQSFIKYCIALKKVFQGCVGLLSLGNFLLLSEGNLFPLHCNLQTLCS